MTTMTKQEIKFQLVERDSKVELPENLVFGRNFTDHVFEMDYNEDEGGWINPTIKKFEEFKISPAAMALHYGQAIFEGLKAYKQDDGKIALFRPEQNFGRLKNSSKRFSNLPVKIKSNIGTIGDIFREQAIPPARRRGSCLLRKFLSGFILAIFKR